MKTLSPSISSVGSAVPLVDAQGALAVRVFVDFWNFHLAMSRWRPRFRLDWQRLGPALAAQAQALWRASGRSGHARFAGLHVYVSHNPFAPQDEGLRRWAQRVLGRFEGVEVFLKSRRPAQPPDCPACHVPIAACPCCGASMRRSAEKGVDTAMVTDMVRLAWEDRWDVAVLLSEDGDFIPAVEHLQGKGQRVIHAGFGADRSLLARTCGASIELADVVSLIERSANDRGVAAAGPLQHPTARARRLVAERNELVKKNTSPSSENPADRGLTG